MKRIILIVFLFTSLFASAQFGVTVDTLTYISGGGKMYHYSTSGDTVFINSDTLLGALGGYWSKTGNYIYTLNDSVGIGTATPADQLSVENRAGVGNLRITGLLDATSQQYDYYLGWNSNDSLVYPARLKRENIAELRVATAIASYVSTAGYYTDGDGGGGEFYWDAASVESDNGGTIIKVNSKTTGRYKRIYDKSGYAKFIWFGAFADSATDDYNAMQAALNSGVKKLIAEKNGVYRYTGVLQVKTGQEINLNDSRFIQDTYPYQGIDVYNADSVFIHNGTIKQLTTRTTPSGTYRGGSAITQCSGIYSNSSYGRFEDLIIDNFTAGVRLFNTDGTTEHQFQQYNNTVQNCNIIDAAHGFISECGDGTQLINITVKGDNSGTTAPGHGVYLSGDASTYRHENLVIDGFYNYETTADTLLNSFIKITHANDVYVSNVYSKGIYGGFEIGNSLDLTIGTYNVFLDNMQIYNAGAAGAFTSYEADSNINITNLTWQSDSVQVAYFRAYCKNSNFKNIRIAANQATSSAEPLVNITGNYNNLYDFHFTSESVRHQYAVKITGDYNTVNNIYGGQINGIVNIVGDNNNVEYNAEFIDSEPTSSFKSKVTGSNNFVYNHGGVYNRLSTDLPSPLLVYPLDYSLYIDTILEAGLTEQFQISIVSTLSGNNSITLRVINKAASDITLTFPSAYFENIDEFITPDSGTSIDYIFYANKETEKLRYANKQQSKINFLTDGKSDNSSLYLGYTAGSSDDLTTNQNVGIGVGTLESLTTASYNTAIGYEALNSNITSNYNTAVGFRALYNTTGNNNTALGQKALYSNIGGLSNIAVGREASYFNTTGGNNTAVGYKALYSNQSGAYNVAIGLNAAYSTTSSNNTAVGRDALYSNTSATGNVAIGYKALNASTGNNNTAIGFDASLTGSFTNSSAIGYQSQPTASNQIMLGDANIATVVTSGELTLDEVTYTNIDGTDGQVLTTDGAGNADFEEPPLSYKHLVTTKSASFTATLAEVTSGVSYVINSSGGEVVMTLPQLSTLPNDGYYYTFNINHIDDANNIKIQTYSGDNFSYGNTYFNIGSHIFSFTLGGYNDGTNQIWSLVRNTTVRGRWSNSATWNATNFSSNTIIPLDTEDYNNQDEILNYSTTAYRDTITTGGTYKVSYIIEINSTGGVTWTATAGVYKNGTFISGTGITTGNYGNEDNTLPLPATYIEVTADDIIDVRLQQTNLTGEMKLAEFNIEIRL